MPSGQSSSQHPKARVNVIGGVKPGAGGVNHIMLENLRRTTPKRLGGSARRISGVTGSVGRLFASGEGCLPSGFV